MTINAAMPIEYGTSNGREQLGGYFDESDPTIIERKNGNLCVPCTRRKKCFWGITAAVVVLIIIIVLAATLGPKVYNKLYGSKSLQSGLGCKNEPMTSAMCGDGTCVSQQFLCDLFPDCPDREDENITSCVQITKKQPEFCDIDTFQCIFDKSCIPWKERCDGDLDCKDGTDEEECFELGQNGVVFVIQGKEMYPLLYTRNERLAEYICKDMRLGAARDYGSSSIKDYRPELCITFPSSDEIQRSLNAGYNLDGFQIQKDCNLDKGFYMVDCQYEECGEFAQFQGPRSSSRLKGPDVVVPTINAAFPWTVDIKKNGKFVCKGTIVNAFWVITARVCISDDMFHTKDSWTISISHDEKSRNYEVTKVMRNHFGTLDNYQSDDLIVLQINPSEPFEFNNTMPVCTEPRVFTGSCLTSGVKKDNSVEHIRLITEDNGKCRDLIKTDMNLTDNLCVTFPNPNGLDCLRTKGAPISCMDPMTNSWTLLGVMNDDLFCDTKKSTLKVAIAFIDERNFNWAKVVTDDQRSEALCGTTANFRNVQYSRGSRAGEVYVEFQNYKTNEWHALYNLKRNSSAFKVLSTIVSKTLERVYQSVRVSNQSQIVTKKAAELSCPEQASSLCSCRVTLSDYLPTYNDASALHFIKPIARDQPDINPEFIDYDYWDARNSNDGIYENVLDYMKPRLSIDAILPLNCTNGNDTFRRCSNETLKCIHPDMVCDGFPDCPYGEDEVIQLCPSYYGEVCNPQNFVCQYSYECIDRSKRCNEEYDCRDRTDEDDCYYLVNKDNVIAEKNGLALRVVAQKEDIDDFTADKFCYEMGFIDSKNFDVTPVNSSADESCYFYKDDKFFMSQQCKQVFRLSCNTCGQRSSAKSLYTSKDFPWLVNITQGGERKCQAAFVRNNWLLAPRTCFANMTSDLSLTSVFDPPSVKDSKIVMKISYHLTYKTNTTKASKTVYNSMLLRIHPPLKKEDKIHPICIEKNAAKLFPACHVYTPNITDAVRLVAASNEDCLKNKVSLLPNQQCMRALHSENDFCARTKDRFLQCIDVMTDRYVLGGLVANDIGSCSSSKSDFVAVNDFMHETGWLLAVGGASRNNDTETCGTFYYDRGNRQDTWYMSYVDNNNPSILYAVSWEDKHSLTVAGSFLQGLSQASQLDEVSEASNITAMNVAKITCPTNTTYICNCTFLRINERSTVKTFYLTQPSKEFEETLVDKEEKDMVIPDGADVMGNDEPTPAQ